MIQPLNQFITISWRSTLCSRYCRQVARRLVAVPISDYASRSPASRSNHPSVSGLINEVQEMNYGFVEPSNYYTASIPNIITESKVTTTQSSHYSSNRNYTLIKTNGLDATNPKLPNRHPAVKSRERSQDPQHHEPPVQAAQTPLVHTSVPAQSLKVRHGAPRQ